MGEIAHGLFGPVGRLVNDVGLHEVVVFEYGDEFFRFVFFGDFVVGYTVFNSFFGGEGE